MMLPGWAVDDKASVAREAAEWRHRTDAERAQALAAACRAAARLLAARSDRERVQSWVDPLPAHSVAALQRLRARAR